MAGTQARFRLILLQLPRRPPPRCGSHGPRVTRRDTATEMQIVLVDSSRVSLKLISQTLAQAGHEVVTFSDGATALEYLRSGYPLDVLLTSFELPHISGLELCWEARLIANEGRPLYVSAMSSNADGHQLIVPHENGEHLPKRHLLRIVPAGRFPNPQNH